MNGCRHPDLPLTSALELRPIELLLLHILRSLCGGLEYDRLGYWVGAFDSAERHLGIVDGPAIVSRCIALLRALRAERDRGFAYMSADCPHISEDEQALMALIRAGRGTQNDDAHLSAVVRQVATSRNPSRLVTAARALGALCIRHESLHGVSSDALRPTTNHLN